VAANTRKVDEFVPTVIDIEASGFGRGSYPIEVGIAMPDGQAHCYLIRPQSDWTHWDVEAEGLHHISQDTLRSHGKDVRLVAQRLNQLLANQTIYSDGWAHDTSWLGLLFESAGISQHFKIDHIACLFSQDQVAIWEQERLQVMQELGINRHRASADARIVQMTYLKTRLRNLN